MSTDEKGFQVGARVRYAHQDDGLCGTVEKVYDGTNGDGLRGEVLVSWDDGGVFIEQVAALTSAR